ncbi:MAG TPA: acyltransferase [Acidimicrobiales bacterium]|jgi:fucose 4-O-acetylase-like acetyltransferase|nr:acyltransferase [Acidimicrobiales bacterium]
MVALAEPRLPLSTVAAPTPTSIATQTPTPTTARDRFVDLLRAGSLMVVVAWHWVFTVVIWKFDGPHASNPLGSTRGLWLLTWLFQVMPLFFFVGGFVHSRTWTPGRYGSFLRKRLGRLVVPAAAAIAAVGAGGLLANELLDSPPWLPRAVILILSPLWFLGVYVLLVFATPIAAAAHRRFGELAVVALAGAAAVVDVLRFRFETPYASVLAWIVVWGFAHQFGFHYERLVAAPRRFAWCLVLGGAYALGALTNMGHYPKSMVGVPGEAISNMAPPTVCIVALCALQVGVALLIRDAALRALDRPRVSRVVGWVSENSMPLYLWHGVGLGIAYGTLRFVAGITVPEETTSAWWLQRPLWILAPALATRPLLRLARRLG